MNPAERTGGVDRAVELLSRWMAARTTRRSFLARLARVAVLVATGPTLAALLIRRAEARVCGQSGVTPKCDTFDCDGTDDVWGWCWYASPGCCSNGGLKKICDCCTWNWPNVHGYCPAGTNVRCIVESCWADPRVMPVGVTRASATDDLVAASLAAADPTGDVVIASADPLMVAVLAPYARAFGASLIVSGDRRLDPRVISWLQHHDDTLGSVLVIDGALGDGATTEAVRYGVDVDAGVEAEGIGEVSARIAGLVLERTGSRRVVAVDPDGVGAALAPVVASAAARAGMPVVVGQDALDAVHGTHQPAVTWLLGPEAAAWRGSFAGAVPVGRGASMAAAARDVLGRWLDLEIQGAVPLVFAPALADGVHGALPMGGEVVVLHPDGVVDGALSEWLRDHQERITSARWLDVAGGLSAAGVWEAQSSLNRFDTHYLQGVAGQGLPVISQPWPEREIGQARIASFGSAEAPEEPAYWLGRARPGR